MVDGVLTLDSLGYLLKGSIVGKNGKLYCYKYEGVVVEIVWSCLRSNHRKEGDEIWKSKGDFS